MINKLT